MQQIDMCDYQIFENYKLIDKDDVKVLLSPPLTPEQFRSTIQTLLPLYNIELKTNDELLLMVYFDNGSVCINYKENNLSQWPEYSLQFSDTHPYHGYFYNLLH